VYSEIEHFQNGEWNKHWTVAEFSGKKFNFWLKIKIVPNTMIFWWGKMIEMKNIYKGETDPVLYEKEVNL